MRVLNSPANNSAINPKGAIRFNNKISSSVHVETAQPHDLPEILALQKLCYSEHAERYSDNSIPPLTQTFAEIETDLHSKILLKATHNDLIVGSIRAFEKEGTCYIGRVIVHPEYQNKGLGGKLMQQIELQFSNVQRFELFTGFRDEKNLYFYQKLGYTIYKVVDESEHLRIVFMEKPAGKASSLSLCLSDFRRWVSPKWIKFV